jgi:GDP-L-fucose synthase
VNTFFRATTPEFVVLAAAKVGGILANDTYPADFISDNLAIQTNVIRAAHATGASRLVFLGSSCIYPRSASQPLVETSLLSGPLESTNEWYAVAKIAGLKLCEAYHRQYARDYFTVMPTNLYGPGDNFDPETSHVLAALLRKFHEAKEANGPVTIWGTGRPRREFLFSDDLGRAIVHLLEAPEHQLNTVAPDRTLNIGVGVDVTISELASLVADVVGCNPPIAYDPSKPDGTPRKLMDVSRIRALGWEAEVSLEEGLKRTYDWFLKTLEG